MDMDAKVGAALEPRVLLAQAGWMRGLARRLVGESEADAVVAESLATALARPPREAGRLGSWLRRVVKNTARQRVRAEGRRRRREQAVAREEALPSTDELVGAAELQRKLVAELLELAEPSRSTLLLRFFHGLEPAAIARSTGVPAGTVRSRLKRGLEELRGRLDARFGERRTWALSLGPWLRSHGDAGVAAGKFTAGGIVLAAWGKLVLVAVATACALVLLRGWGRSSSPPEPVVVAPATQLEVAPLDERARATAEPADVVLATDDERVAVLADEVALAPATGWAGTVRSKAGAPLEGATVTLFRKTPDDWARGEVLHVATTDETGRYELPHEEGGALRLVATHANHEESGKDVDAPGEGLDFALYPTVELVGTVRDATTGAPIEGAQVNCRAQVAWSNASGRFSIPKLPLGLRCELAVLAPGYARHDEALFPAEDEPCERDVVLEPGLPLRIELVDAFTDTAVAGAHVGITSSSWSQPFATSDEEGAFELWIADGCNASFVVEAAGYAPMRVRWDVDAAGSWPPLRLPLFGYAFVEGRVVDESGAPVEGLWFTTLTTADDSDGASRRRVELGVQDGRDPASLPDDLRCQVEDGLERPSDDAGCFSVAVIPGADSLYVAAWPEGYVPVRSDPFVLSRPGERIEVELALARGASIRGRALYNGNPVRLGSVHFRHDDGRSGAARVDRDGGYVLRGVPAGTVELRLSVGSLLDTVPEPERFDVVVGETVEHDFVWSEELVPIHGRVTDVRGAVVAGWTVRAECGIPNVDRRQFTGRTEEDGTYALPVAPGRAYTVSVVADPVVRSIADVAPGDVGIDFVLPDRGTFVLELVDVASGEPIAFGRKGSRLSWREAGAEAFQACEPERGRPGRVELGLPVGRVDLSLHLDRDGYAPRVVHGLNVVTGEPEPVVVSLERGLELELACTGPDGPARPASPLVLLLHESRLASVRGPFPHQGGPSNHRINGVCMWIGDPGLLNRIPRFRDDGRARLEGLAPGRYVLRAYPDELVFEPDTFDVDAATTVLQAAWRPR